jgi:multidrug efflux system outer membrane protein
VNGYLSNLLTAPVVIPRAEHEEKLATLKREAMSMAVLAKLYISYQEYYDTIKYFERAKQLLSVDERLYRQIANRTVIDVQGDLERILAQASSVDSKLRLFQCYAEAQAALGRLYATLGIDLLHEQAGALSVADVSEAIRRTSIDLSGEATSLTVAQFQELSLQ